MFRTCAGILTAAGFFTAALPEAEAGLTGFISLDGGTPVSLGSQIGVNPSFSFFNNLGGVSLFGGAASNAPGAASNATLFDAAVFIANNTAAQHTLHFIFQEDDFSSPTGLVLATSIGSAASTTGGVTMDAFSSIVAGTPIITGGLPVAITPGFPYSNSTSSASPIAIPAGAFAMSQDFTMTLLANASVNFSNSLAATPFPAVGPVPEPGTIIYGVAMVSIGLSQLIRRRRIRSIVG